MEYKHPKDYCWVICRQNCLLLYCFCDLLWQCKRLFSHANKALILKYTMYMLTWADRGGFLTLLRLRELGPSVAAPDVSPPAGGV